MKIQYSKFQNQKKNSYIRTYLNRMEKNTLVHINEEGIKLTKWGMERAREVRKKLNL